MMAGSRRNCRCQTSCPRTTTGCAPGTSSGGCRGRPSDGDTRVSGNADAVDLRHAQGFEAAFAGEHVALAHAGGAELRHRLQGPPPEREIVEHPRLHPRRGHVLRLQAHDPAAFDERQPLVEQLAGQLDPDHANRHGRRQRQAADDRERGILAAADARPASSRATRRPSSELAGQGSRSLPPANQGSVHTRRSFTRRCRIGPCSASRRVRASRCAPPGVFTQA